jgi:VWFA-related protein
VKYGALGLIERTLHSQQARDSDGSAFSADIRVVNVFASVRRRNGRIAADLKREDFRLFEDGQPQSIVYFSRETNVPLELGFLLDTSASQCTILSAEKRASYRFFQQVLRDGTDETFLIRFDDLIDLLQDRTHSAKDLIHALDTMEACGSPRRRLKSGRISIRSLMNGLTKLYDAIYLACNEVMPRQDVRKALVVLTDGVDHRSRVSLDSAIQSARRSNTAIYSIFFAGYEGEDSKKVQVEGTRVLKKMSEETGGRFFAVSYGLGIDSIYAQLTEDLRNQYSLGYTPDRPWNDDAWRAIRLEIPNSDFTIYCRPGYYPKRPQNTKQ